MVRHSTLRARLVNLNNSAAYLRYCPLQCYLDMGHYYVELQSRLLSVKCSYYADLSPAYIITKSKVLIFQLNSE